MSAKLKETPYSAEAISLLEKIKEKMAAGGVKNADVAKKCGMTSSLVSQVLGGTYSAPPEEHLNKILDSLSEAEKTAETRWERPYLDTDIQKLVHLAGNHARRNKAFSVVTADVGLGKTTALNTAWMFNAPIVVNSTELMTKTILLETIADGIRDIDGDNAGGGAARKFDTIVKKLKGRDVFIAVDEAETLKPKLLELLRRLSDLAEIGVLLVGTSRLRVLIAPEKGVYQQIRSRVLFFPPHVTHLSRADAGLIISEYLPEADDDAKDEIINITKGNARILRRGLIPNIKSWRKNNPTVPLTPEVIRAIAGKVMTIT